MRKGEGSGGHVLPAKNNKIWENIIQAIIK